MPLHIHLWNALDDDKHRRQIEGGHANLLKLRDTLRAILYPKPLNFPNEKLERQRDHVRQLTDQFIDAVIRPSTFLKYVSLRSDIASDSVLIKRAA